MNEISDKTRVERWKSNHEYKEGMRMQSDDRVMYGYQAKNGDEILCAVSPDETEIFYIDEAPIHPLMVREIKVWKENFDFREGETPRNPRRRYLGDVRVEYIMSHTEERCGRWDVVKTDRNDNPDEVISVRDDGKDDEMTPKIHAVQDAIRELRGDSE